MPLKICKDCDSFGTIYVPAGLNIETDEPNVEDPIVIRIPPNTVKLHNKPLSEWHVLREAELPDSLTVVEEGLFAKSCIRRVFIPQSVTEMQKGAFAGCVNLVKVTFATHSKL